LKAFCSIPRLFQATGFFDLVVYYSKHFEEQFCLYDLQLMVEMVGTKADIIARYYVH
jgi:hypothetical protein